MPHDQKPPEQDNKAGMNPVRWFLSMPVDSTARTVLTAVGLCFVCAIFVSAAAVSLRPQQALNQELDKQRNILEVAGLMQPGASIPELFKQVEPRIVDLRTGRFTDAVDPETFDGRKASRDPELSMALPDGEDPAGIGRRGHYKTVYLVRTTDGTVQTVIVPVHGYGLWSTLYGFLALAPDGNTIQGLQFYQHAETPGLGGEVDNPRWRALWDGINLYGEDGEVRVAVEKGDQSNDPYAVDALSGASLTSQGVHRLLRFWASEMGYQPFLKRLPEELSRDG